jgi:hypothetical protein
LPPDQTRISCSETSSRLYWGLGGGVNHGEFQTRYWPRCGET